MTGGPELKSRLSVCSNLSAPLVEMPTADTQIEDGLFTFASHVFLQTADAPECLETLERLLGTVRLQYLLLFLAFVRAVLLFAFSTIRDHLGYPTFDQCTRTTVFGSTVISLRRATSSDVPPS